MSLCGILKQSTAVNVIIGPFVDSANGDDEETGLTIAQADVRLSKNAGADAQKNDNTTCAHEGDGFYMCELDATDTNTVGQLTLWVHVAGALAVRHDFQIVEEAVYDQLFGASALGYIANAPVSVAQWNGSNVASPDTAGYPKVTIKSGTGTGEISLSSGGVSVRGNIKKAAAFTKLMFLMTDSTNHNPATGKTVTATISKDGGSFASLNSGDSVTEVANGIYEIDLDGTDTNCNNAILRFTATACDDTFVHLFTEV
jgi:hypothetical protein